jgi:protein-S-isoprenylcysteine O-methyltransferase Ste14
MALLLKNLLFTVLAPGTVGVCLPILISRGNSPASGSPAVLAMAILSAGSALYGWCVWHFAVTGHATPAPIDAPTHLVVRKAYRHTRNPMYLGVMTVIIGWAILFHAGALVLYLVAVAASFHLTIVLCEEPHLSRRFGGDYDEYRSRVSRWAPGIRPFPG